MNSTQARDLLVKLLEQHQYEQRSLATPPPDAGRITVITPGDLGVAVTFADGSRVLYAVITEGGAS